MEGVPFVSDIDDIRARYAQIGLDVSALSDAQVMAMWFADRNNDLDDALPDLEDRFDFVDDLSSGMSARESVDAYVARLRQGS